MSLAPNNFTVVSSELLQWCGDDFETGETREDSLSPEDGVSVGKGH